ncbi:hypothetical protein [Sphingobacterium corticibacterium]|uniref:Uncharacterized protein n=1 Tax=Sphingobacterium corticibacterium TaxID=2484746 RepID=A0A4V2DCP5_9SPHI|nr:hypothetical protein [Sphingobacterium corticibacterium]RZF62208.1 hypothetical protein EWE74_05225 [Sphingobacterium corticibacterium]
MKRHLYAHSPYPIVPEEQRTNDWRYQLMELSEDALLKKVNAMPREKLIEWLAWNDVYGIFRDEDSIAEGYEPLSKEHAAICVFVVVMRSREGWDGNMGGIYVKDISLAVSTEV